MRLILAKKKILFHNEKTLAKMSYFSVSSIKYIYPIEGRDFFFPLIDEISIISKEKI